MKKKNLYNFFEYWSKVLRTFVKKISAKFQKMHFRAFQRKFLNKFIFFLGKNSCLSTEVEGEGFSKSVETFDGFVKTAFYVSERDFWVNCFFFELFWVSSLFFNCGKNILQHWRKNFGKFVKGAFYLNNKFFRWKIVFWRNFLL